MSASALRSRSERILYPDSDGQPMSDDTIPFRWIVLIKEGKDRAAPRELGGSVD